MLALRCTQDFNAGFGVYTRLQCWLWGVHKTSMLALRCTQDFNAGFAVNTRLQCCLCCDLLATNPDMMLSGGVVDFVSLKAHDPLADEAVGIHVVPHPNNITPADTVMMTNVNNAEIVCSVSEIIDKIKKQKASKATRVPYRCNLYVLTLNLSDIKQSPLVITSAAKYLSKAAKYGGIKNQHIGNSYTAVKFKIKTMYILTMVTAKP
ncbi:hypothetical protein MAR_010259 [Mya arenaria]|uniref:Uncharacterized protein n=1 Tax=Mya arenaria TaxID=6604 RepID=A0ABY7E968_MYAAR|nr:hypothetical protein MAR_010259 [Mya arenaria]